MRLHYSCPEEQQQASPRMATHLRCAHVPPLQQGSVFCGCSESTPLHVNSSYNTLKIVPLVCGTKFPQQQSKWFWKMTLAACTTHQLDTLHQLAPPLPKSQAQSFCRISMSLGVWSQHGHHRAWPLMIFHAANTSCARYIAPRQCNVTAVRHQWNGSSALPPGDFGDVRLLCDRREMGCSSRMSPGSHSQEGWLDSPPHCCSVCPLPWTLTAHTHKQSSLL